MGRGRQRKKSRSSGDSQKSGTSGTSDSRKQNGHVVTSKTTNGSSENTDPRLRPLKHIPSLSTLNRIEREQLVLYKQPFKTIFYFFKELIYLSYESILFFTKQKLFALLAGILTLVLYFVYKTPGPHQEHIRNAEKQILWSFYWIGLGVASSIGLGTGLHTFLLYLGPHIARVTLAAYDCKSLDFPSPPYPEDVICPENALNMGEIGLWAIINKVRLEALMWGVGTALGELPPYFMARTARMSGEEPDDEEYAEYLAFVRGKADKIEMAIWERWKYKLENCVISAGFIGILLFASIPNPLFDLAGMICGHSLVSFWTFFGATLLGKALIKAHVQMFFVILTFSEHHVDSFIKLIENIPIVSGWLQKLFRDFFTEQKRRLHRSPGEKISEQGTSLLQQIITIVITIMIARFVYDIVNALAKKHHKRCNDNDQPVKKGKRA